MAGIPAEQTRGEQVVFQGDQSCDGGDVATEITSAIKDEAKNGGSQNDNGWIDLGKG